MISIFVDPSDLSISLTRIPTRITQVPAASPRRRPGGEAPLIHVAALAEFCPAAATERTSDQHRVFQNPGERSRRKDTTTAATHR